MIADLHSDSAAKITQLQRFYEAFLIERVCDIIMTSSRRRRRSTVVLETECLQTVYKQQELFSPIRSLCPKIHKRVFFKRFSIIIPIAFMSAFVAIRLPRFSRFVNAFLPSECEDSRTNDSFVMKFLLCCWFESGERIESFTERTR